jgi:hypothetical protein
MSRVMGIAGAVLAVVVLTTAAPVTGQAQVLERPRRSSSSFDRAYQLGFDVGYRTGYDRGVEARRDGRSQSPTDFKEYRRGDDGYNDRVGDREQFRLGYRAGFDKGYTDGQGGRQYGARAGQNRVDVGRVGRGGRNGGGPVLQRGPDGSYPPQVGRNRGAYPGGGYGGGRDAYGYGSQRMGFNTSLVIELETPITTRHSQEGDRFSAIVVEPQSYYGARVEGYIGELKRPGKVAGKGEIVLVFTDILWPDGLAEPMQAQVEEILGYPRGVGRPSGRGPLGGRAPWEWGKNDDRNDDIDAKAGDEGQIEGKGSKGRDAAVVGGGTAVGAAIGSVIGGGGGAAVGAVIGAVAGGGIVATTRGHEIDLEPGAQLRIRTGQGVR